MSDFLADMATASQARVERVRGGGLADLDSRVESAPAPIAFDVSSPGFDVIAEAKLASPSEGRLATGEPGVEQVSSLVEAYESRGAAAISVLTEPSRFAGELEHLEVAARTVELPVMRKDFLVDPIQILEARAAGASGVLLIARMLPDEALVEMADLTIDLGMFALVEVFDVSDLDKAGGVFDRDVLIGVNCRDLTTLGIERERFETIAAHLPEHLPAVAESGMTRPEHVAAVASLGYRLALVGSSLVASGDPAGMLEQFISAGRNAVSQASS